MIETTNGYRLPEDGDLALESNGWFETMEFNIRRFDQHSHDGNNSEQLSLNSMDPYSGVIVGPQTFLNTAIDDGADTITITGHGWTESGAPVVYNEGAGNTITGLTDGVTYYVIYVDANTIQLALSEANALAGTQIDIADSVDNSTDNELNPWVVDGVTFYQTITAPAGIDDINNYNAKFVFTAPAAEVGEVAYLDYDRQTATTYKVYCNDNTAGFTVTYR